MEPAQQTAITKNKTFHVLHIASGDLWAGAEVMLYILAKTLHTELNMRVTVILLNPGILEQKLRDCNVPVYVLDESRSNSFQLVPQLNRIISEIKPDVIHTHRIKENILGSIVAWHNHIPSLRTAHGAAEHRPPLYKLAKRLILLLDWFLGRFYQQHIIAVSSELAKKLECDFPQSKINVIENGVDIDSITRHISRDHSITTDNKHYRIGIAGRLVPVKRVDLFIKTAVYLKQHHPELAIHFHIYGDGPLHDTLQAQVQSQQADNYIHFEGHCDNIAQELQTLDALLMTSDHEGLPMVLLEAMCLQIPIISHAVGGIPNLLDEGKCGVLIHHQSAKAFTEAIVNLLSQPEQRQHLTQLAFARVKKYYSAKHTAAAYSSIYKEMTE